MTIGAAGAFFKRTGPACPSRRLSKLSVCVPTRRPVRSQSVAFPIIRSRIGELVESVPAAIPGVVASLAGAGLDDAVLDRLAYHGVRDRSSPRIAGNSSPSWPSRRPPTNGG